MIKNVPKLETVELYRWGGSNKNQGAVKREPNQKENACFAK